MGAMVKVLVVDDDEPVRTSLVNFLEDEGFDPVSAPSGEEALEMVRRQDFHVAVVDMRLPGIDGDTVVMESHKLRPGMKFLIYTGSDDYFPQATLVEMGLTPQHVFFKPLRNLSILSQAIHALTQGAPIPQ